MLIRPWTNYWLNRDLYLFNFTALSVVLILLHLKRQIEWYLDFDVLGLLKYKLKFVKSDLSGFECRYLTNFIALRLSSLHWKWQLEWHSSLDPKALCFYFLFFLTKCTFFCDLNFAAAPSRNPWKEFHEILRLVALNVQQWRLDFSAYHLSGGAILTLSKNFSDKEIQASIARNHKKYFYTRPLL